MYKEFKGLPEVLETLQDANNPVMESIKSIMNSKSIVQVMQNCTLTPKEVLYFSSPLLEGLYEAYFAVQLSPCVDACIFPAYEPPETLTAFFIRALNAEKFSLETAQYLFRQGVSIKDVYHRHVHHWGFIEGERLYEFSKTLSIPHWEDIMSILVIYYYNIPSYSLIKYMLENADWGIEYLLIHANLTVGPFPFFRQKLFSYGFTEEELQRYYNGEKIVVNGIEYKDKYYAPPLVAPPLEQLILNDSNANVGIGVTLP
jgi:hypothetical protein